MFDIGFSELLLFGVIALIVLGPEKLPQAARTAGQWYAKIRRTVSTLQSEIEAELDLAETRQQMQKELAKIRQTEAEMRREMAEMRGSMQEFESSQNQTLKAVHDSANSVDTSKHTAENENSVSNKLASAPKEFDYAYGDTGDTKDAQQGSISDAADSNETESLDSQCIQSNDPAESIVQPAMTKPWENMWFRLGDYDKARRLPAPPYLPNYKADILLNSPLHSHSNTQASVNTQETN